MMRILLVDDDTELCAMLAEYLGTEGYEADAVHDGEAGVAAALSGKYGIMVLDVMMPRMGGIETLRQIREKSRIPVIMLTAKGDDIDRIIGLELGADDYVPKPCQPRELVARLRAILRRTGNTETTEDDPVVPLVSGPLQLNPAYRRAEWNGEPLDLTSSEFNLLEMLLRAQGKVLNKNELCEQALGRPFTRYDRSVDVHMSNLRQKLGNYADGRTPIQTVRGIGYQWLTE
ncbi:MULTISPECIES: response regulator transcription factor [Silvimonas]|uniref:response regulator transcription factor n=1 Tax=Silvimonas TaxID=300264 RepID=UPI0024B35E12|nr:MULTISPECIES: response regulator transcription factor [Silvimonas]MDR3425983.1 response regulator transcription factor [Silvimonas sp.]